MTLTAADRKRLLPHIERAVSAIEQILSAGLTTASQSTHQTFAITFQEASRLKLLRLGSTLRSTHEEISRYVKDDPRFSQNRLVFFLNRSWLLCKGLQAAIATNDTDQINQLLWTPPTQKVKSLTVVCVGVVKKIAAGNFCAFEFRLRTVETNESYTWSTVFPLKPGVEIPAEGYLHLPQKQKFTAAVFLEKKCIEIKDFLVTRSQTGQQRIRLTDESTVSTTESVEDWTPHLSWNVATAVERIEQHSTTPFDVEIELQEEIYFDDYALAKPQKQTEPPRQIFHLNYRGTELDAAIADTIEGQAALSVLNKEAKSKQPRGMLALLHYSACRLVVQPLTLFEHTESEPTYITISDKSVDRKALLSALNFR